MNLGVLPRASIRVICQLQRSYSTRKTLTSRLLPQRPDLQSLVRSRTSRRWTNAILRSKLASFSKDSTARWKSSMLGVRGSLFTQLADDFVHDVRAGLVPEYDPRQIDAVNLDVGSVDRMLLHAFYAYCQRVLPKDVAGKMHGLQKTADLSNPGEWFPGARKMRRKIFLHVGPVGSGKEYDALQRLSMARSGIYCGSIRQQAYEIQEFMNKREIPCSLLTEEERHDLPDATVLSATVEMATLGTPVDVAVINDIHMIGDKKRGWAWTRALLGLQASEIHLCGERSVIPLIMSICQSLDEQIIVEEYSRATPLSVANKSLQQSWSQVEPGDCVVAFKRNDIFFCKKEIEAATGYQCAAVYDGLPYETRARIAKSFNDGSSGAQILVSSGAIALGLMLNIKRIVFTTVKKTDSVYSHYLTASQIKQLANQAGSNSSMYPTGVVTTFASSDLPYVEHAMGAPDIPIKAGGIRPTLDIIELFAAQATNCSFASLLQLFEEMATISSDFFLADFENLKTIANWIDHIPMPIKHRYQFVTAPAAVGDKRCREAMQTMAQLYSDKKVCTIEKILQTPSSPAENLDSLNVLESTHRLIMLYLWFRQRYPETFVTSQEHVLQIKQRCEDLIESSLQNPALFQVTPKRLVKKSRHQQQDILFPLLNSIAAASKSKR